MPVESWATSEASRRSMLANKSQDTRPELAVRRELHRRGMRYRVHVAPLEGVRRRVDISFPRQRVAVLIDGCFWHKCPQHHRSPRSHRDYWSSKIERNVIRDRATTQLLEQAGWRVLRFWEHENPIAVADSIESVVRGESKPEARKRSRKAGPRSPGPRHVPHVA